jgi:hypothetical protein
MCKWIAFFKKKNKIKSIAYYSISPMGKEAVYYMAFSLSELRKAQKAIFTSK